MDTSIAALSLPLAFAVAKAEQTPRKGEGTSQIETNYVVN